MYHTNIIEYLELSAPEYTDKLAFSDGADSLSFRELYDVSCRVGSFLSDKGYMREPIALMMGKHPDTVAAMLGVVSAGCFYTCLDPDMPRQRVELILEKLSPRAIIYDEENRERAEELSTSAAVYPYTVACSFSVDAERLTWVRSQALDTDPVYVVFTSGSTGMPKGVVASHRSVIDYTETLCEALGFSDKTVFGNQAPLCFDAPLKEIMPTLKLGATTYLIPRKLFLSPVRLCEFLDEHRINTVCWVASALVLISASGALERYRPSHLETVCFGSEVFPSGEYKKWRAAYPQGRLVNLYGPTEATGMSCYWIADRELEDSERIPIGRPFRNTEIILLGDDLSPVPDGEQGEIFIRGSCLTLGYFGDSERTGRAFVQNPLNQSFPELVYRTGDIGRKNSHGELEFICRADGQIKLMGHRIELGEIETAAQRLCGVSRAAAVFDSESRRIILYFTGTPEASEVIAHLKERLPRYMLPRRAYRLEAMPLTQSGKLDRGALLALFCASK